MKESLGFRRLSFLSLEIKKVCVLHRCIYYREENMSENCFARKLVWKSWYGIKRRFNEVVIVRHALAANTCEACFAFWAGHTQPFATAWKLQDTAKIASCPRSNAFTHISVFTSLRLVHCAVNANWGRLNRDPPKTLMIDTILKKRHAFLTRYFPWSIRAKIPFCTLHEDIFKCPTVGKSRK